MFEKIEVNGPQAHPLYNWLKNEKAGVLGSQAIKWNFTKFLLGREGRVLKRYGSATKPEALQADIEKALQARSEERRGGKECVSTGRSRWSQCHEKKKNNKIKAQ